MDYCSLEDAFPQIDNRSIKEKGSDTKTKAAKSSKKKAKRAEAQVQTPSLPTQDPDRQAFAKFDVLEKFQTARGPEDIPTLPKAPSLFTERGNAYPGSTPTPSYFGKGLDDEEGYSMFTNMIGDDPNYILNPAALDSAFDATGASKAGSSAFDTISPPVPSAIDVWKTVLPTGTFSSFLTTAIPTEEPNPRKEASTLAETEPTKELQAAGHLTDTYEFGAAGTGSTLSSPEKEELLQKIDSLKKRIDQLEVRRQEDTQTELLLFVCTGVLLQVGLQTASVLAS